MTEKHGKNRKKDKQMQIFQEEKHTIYCIKTVYSYKTIHIYTRFIHQLNQKCILDKKVSVLQTFFLHWFFANFKKNYEFCSIFLEEEVEGEIKVEEKNGRKNGTQSQK